MYRKEGYVNEIAIDHITLNNEIFYMEERVKPFIHENMKGKKVEIKVIDEAKKVFNFIKVLNPEFSDKKKQEIIVRQSCLKSAIDLYGSNEVILLNDILKTAEKMESWVWR